MQFKIILAVLVLGGLTVWAEPPASRPTTAPATRPVDPKVKALIAQLGDDDPRLRDAATAALRKLGKEALPGLEVATRDEDPQIRISAEALVAEQREKENPRKVAVGDLPFLNLHGTQIVFNIQAVGNGQMTRDISINDNGHKVHIHEDPNGVKVEVTDNGETKTYTAKNSAELKEKQPEGYKVYEKYSNNGVGPLKIQVAPN